MNKMDAHPPGIKAVAGWIHGSDKHSFVEIGHEIICMAILSLPLN